ncbi:hemolysin family protein [Psychromicrobium xiongbiense]|uniref:hemolysin family protein n=1 Tax=Psychromicrobium xiongbiense TaxID=3051184 RepID=UPI002555BEB4|nr:hemolysin family protein [Psychromicrobium sp. YIM S02556]
MSDWWGILWLVLLLLSNAFFVAAEFAVMSARRSQIEPYVEKGSTRSKRARIVLYAMEHVSLMLACAQLGITVSSLLILNVAEPSIKHLVLDPLVTLGVPDSVGTPVVFVLVLLLVTFLHVTFGEMVPKNISVSVADRAALLLAPPLVWLSRVVRPIIVALNWSANHILRLLGIEPKDEVSSTFTLEEVQSIVAESTRHGLVDDGVGLLSGALEFSARTAGQTMVPLVEVQTLPATVSPSGVEAAVRRTGFSRFVLRRTGSEAESGSETESGSAKLAGSGMQEEADDGLVGYVHLKDVLSVPEQEYDWPLDSARVRSLIEVPEAEEIEDALRTMQRRRAHLARVIGEDGSTRGILFLEDILEELVGEIRERQRD